MKIQTQHILSGGIELDFEASASDFEPVKGLIESEGCEFVTPVSIELKIDPMPDFFRVQGRIRATVKQACVRCLKAFEHRLDSTFTLDYSKEIPNDLHNDEKEGVELTAQQIGVIHYAGDEIDFKDAIQEQIVLAMPYRAICGDQCQGLCPQCGSNLNDGACQCGDRVGGGPFDILKKMKLPHE